MAFMRAQVYLNSCHLGSPYRSLCSALTVVPKCTACGQEKYEEGYGTVLDSGTTFTYLPSEAFKAFKDAVSTFALSKGLKTTKGPDPKFYDICFGGAPHVEHADQLEHVFPHLELQFQGVSCHPCQLHSSHPQTQTSDSLRFPT